MIRDRAGANALVIAALIGVLIWLAACTGGDYHRTPRDHQIAVIYRDDLHIDHAVKEAVGLPIHWLLTQVQGAAVTFKEPVWVLVDCVILLPNPTEANPVGYYNAIAQHEAGNCADHANGEIRDPLSFEVSDDDQIKILAKMGVLALPAP